MRAGSERDWHNWPHAITIRRAKFSYLHMFVLEGIDPSPTQPADLRRRQVSRLEANKLNHPSRKLDAIFPEKHPPYPANAVRTEPTSVGGRLNPSWRKRPVVAQRRQSAQSLPVAPNQASRYFFFAALRPKRAVHVFFLTINSCNRAEMVASVGNVSSSR